MEDSSQESRLLEQAPLDQADKEMWREALAQMSPDDRENIFSLVRENEKLWLFFTENLKGKLEAVKKGDREWLNWIAAKEQEFLEQMS